MHRKHISHSYKHGKNTYINIIQSFCRKKFSKKDKLMRKENGTRAQCRLGLSLDSSPRLSSFLLTFHLPHHNYFPFLSFILLDTYIPTSNKIKHPSLHYVQLLSLNQTQKQQCQVFVILC